MDHTIRPNSDGNQRRPVMTSELLTELRAMREEQRQFRRLFDQFAYVYLNAKFPYGRATDRWHRR